MTEEGLNIRVATRRGGLKYKSSYKKRAFLNVNIRVATRRGLKYKSSYKKRA